MPDLLPLATAQAKLLELITQLQIEYIPVRDASGRYAAQDVSAQRSQPSDDLSAMDGFAVAGRGPWTICGESRCGAPFAGTLTPGEAVRISTGAVMPPRADAVLIKENALIAGEQLDATITPQRGAYVRRKEIDFAEGEVILERGSRVGPAQLGLLLASGCHEIAVARRANVMIVECGDELAANLPSSAGSIPASNGAMLAAMAEGEACSITVPAPLPDDLGTIASALEQGSDFDLIVICGGASVGDHDLLRPALKAIGAQLAFWRIAMKPGKPLMVATHGHQLILGLPGNPVSSFVTGFLFMLPVLRALSGARETLPRPVMVPSLSTLPETGQRREFLRATHIPTGVTPLDQQDSSVLSALAAATCLIERPECSPAVKAGTPVPVYWPFDCGLA